jgi:hypothetical protein
MAIISNGTTVASGGKVQGSGESLTRGPIIAPDSLGSYGQLQRTPANTLFAVGDTQGGSNLRWSSCGGATSGQPAGTWKLFGRIDNNHGGLATSLWMRIS